MGDAATLTMPNEFYIRPEQLKTSERFNIRRFPGDPEKEAQKVERLAATIERDGQMETVIVVKDPEDAESYLIISGHRRRRAFLMINEKRTAGNKPLLSIRCRLDSEGDPKRKALVNNIQREQLSPMDVALEIKTLREENKWEGVKGTKQVAAYLGLEYQEVQKLEILLLAGPDVQQKLHVGNMTIDSVHDMLNVPPESEETVLKKAEEIQRAKDQRLTPRARKIREEKGIQDGERLERTSVRDAIRETGAADVKVPLTRKELIEHLDALDSPAYGFEDGAVRRWVRYLVDKFAKGEGKAAQFRKLFEAMTAKAPKGTKPVKESKPTKEQPDKPAAKKKAAKKAPAKKDPPKKSPKKAKAKKATEEPAA